MFFQRPISWLALFCAVSSAGLWIWSRRLPDSHWESSEKIALALPSPANTESAAATGAEPAQPSNESPSEPTPAPASTPAALAETRVPEPTPSPAAAASPAPPDANLAGPLPVQTEPAASPPSQPSPAAGLIPPASLDVAEIAKQPELWPKQVLLLASVRFPVILNGMNIGNVQVPPGRAVFLRKVHPDGTVEIELPGTQASLAKVKAQSTDLVSRTQALATARKNAAQETPAPAAP
ncbi:MAG: hypothetical protein WCO68_01365 [Verrucomicrobiota bacterium]